MVRNRVFGSSRTALVEAARRRPGTYRRNRESSRQLVLEGLEDRVLLATRTWTGAVNNLWSNPGNWDVAPVNGDDLVFPTGATNFVTVDNLPGLVIGSIQIDDSQYQFASSFSGAATITNGITTTYGSGAASIVMNFSLGNGQITVASGGELDIDAAISGSAGLTLAGGGTLSLGGTDNNSYTGGTTVNAGTLLLSKTVDGTVAIPAGTFTIGDGAGTDLVQLRNFGNQISDSANVVINGTSASLDLNNLSDAIGSLTMTGGTVQTGTGTLTLGGDVTSNSAAAAAVISGNLDLGGATRTFTIADNAGLDPDLSITANISGTGAGLIKAGASSQLLLSGNNTYDGLTTVNAGALEVSSANALGATTAGTVVSNGASLTIVGSVALAAEPIDISGSGLGGLGAIVNGSGTSSLSGPITLSANSSIGVQSGGSLTISSQITDGAGPPFSLTKVGTGTLTLSNANPYDGGTIVNAGVLAITNGGALGSAGATVASGATLELSNNITVANQITASGTGVGGNGAVRSTGGANTISGGLTLSTDPTAIGVDASSTLTIGTTGVGGGANDLNLVGAGTLNLNADAAGGYNGDLNVNGGRLNVNANYSASATTVNSGGTLGGDGSVGTTTINGSGTLAPGAASTPGQLDTGAISFSAGSAFNVELNGTTAGTQYDRVNASGAVALGAGNATLNVSLGFVPSIGDSFMILEVAGALPLTGTFAGLPQGATITLGNADLQISYTGNDGNDVVLTVTSVTYTWDGGGGDSNWTTAANWVNDIAPTAGSNLVFPDGAARLTNNNDFAANTNFNNITISGASYNFFGNTIDLDGDLSATYTSGTSGWNLGIDLQSDTVIDVATGGTLFISSAVTGGAVNVTKTGGGTLAYGGSTANTYTGTTTVNDGTLLLFKDSGVTSIAGNLVVGDNSGGELVRLDNSNQIANTATVTVNEGATFNVNAQTELVAGLVVQGATVSLPSGSIFALGVGGITSNATTNDVTSTISGTGQLDLGGTSSFPINVANDVDITVELRISSTIVNGGITKTGTGMLALAGSNTYAGATNVNAGAIQVESDSALGTTAADTTVANGASVFFVGATLVVPESFNITGTGLASSGVLAALSGGPTLSGNINLTGPSQIGAAAGAVFRINGVIDDISSPLNLTVVQGSTGRTIISNSNVNFAGAITVTSGFLRLTNDNALGDLAVATTTTVQSSASLELAGGINLPATKSLALDGLPVTGSSKLINVSGDNGILGPITLTSNNQSFDVAASTTLTSSGALGGSVNLDKNGAGTLVLASATNTHTGQLNVLAGTMLVNGNYSTSSLVNVDGTLGGTGTLPAVSVSSIGTLAPGTSPGILNVGNTTLVSGSNFNVEINGTTVGTQYDQLNVTGTVDLGGATLNVTSGFTATPGDVFVIINNDSTDAVTGTFSGLAEGSTISSGANTFRISYIGGTNGNDVTLTAVGTPTVTTISSANPSVFGQAVTFSATVTGTGPTPTGNASLIVDGSTIQTVALVSGTATFTAISNLTVGSHTVTVDYAGDTNYAAASDSLDGGQTVNQASTTTTVTSAPDPSVFGQAVTITATVTADAPGSGTPTGTVTFVINGSPTVVALVGGVATLTTSSLPVGTSTITATYSGDTNFTASSGADTQVVNQAATTTTVTSAPDPSVFGEAVTITATVAAAAPGAGTPTGTVTFVINGSPTVVALVGGVATLTTSSLPVGVSTITATYSGDTNFTASSGADTQTVNQAATTTTVTSAPDPSVFGEAVTITATVAAVAPGAGTPTGTVTFVVNGSPTVVALVGGVATLTTSSLPVGVNAIVATYTGDTNFTGSSSTDTQTVNQASTTTAVSSSANPSVFGQAVTFTAIVSPVAPGAGTPAGNASLVVDGTTVETVALAGGTATFTAISSLSIGTHTVVVNYLGDTNFTASSGTLAGGQVVGQATTVTAVNSSANPSVFGQSVTFSATVTPVPPGAGTPTGNATLVLDGIAIETVALASGIATFTPVSNLTVGIHTVVVNYLGDTNFQVSSGALLGGQTVNQAATTTLVSSNVNPSVFGQPVTFSTIVSANAPGAGTPTGNVSLVVDGTTVETVALTAGAATFTAISSLSVGTHTVQVAYAGDTNFTSSTGTLAGGQVVNQATTSTAVSSNVNPSVFGQPVTFSTIVSANAPGAGTPTGNVSLVVDGSTIETVALTAGAATFTAISSLSVGTHTVQVAYEGDTNFTGSTGTLTGGQVVNQATTTTAVASSLNPSVFGQPVTFSAIVSANAPGAGTPSGTANLVIDGTTVQTVALVGGTATFTPISSLTIGTHTVVVDYAGDTNFLASSGNLVGGQVVNRVPTTTNIIVASPNPSVFGQSVTFSALVTPASGGPATGSVEFYDGDPMLGGTLLGTGTLSAFGIATINTNVLSAGTHSIFAKYLGDATYDESTTDGGTTQIVSAASTTTSVLSSSNPSVFGQAVTFTAIVAPVAPGAGTPTGNATLVVDGTTTETVALVGGTATFTAIGSLAVGTHTVVVSYEGDTNFNASSGTLAGGQQVFAASTTTVLSSDANPAVFGQTVTFTATVSANAPGAGTPTGTVSFFDGATLLGTGTLTGGVATFSTSTLSVGTHPITATYGGSTSYNASSSTVLPQVISKADTTATVASSVNPSVFGQAVTFSVIVAAAAPATGTPSGNVSLIVDGTTVETVALTAGAASFTPISSLSVGTHTVTVAYDGDTSFNPTTGTLAGGQVVNQATTTTVVSSNVNPSVFGQPVTFSTIVSANAPGAGTPSGNVSLIVDGTTVETVALTAGAASFTPISSLSVGTHTVQVVYAGDPSFSGSTGTLAGGQVVNQATTTTVVSSDVNPSVFGQPVTFSTIVSANAPGAGTPTGNVSLVVDGTTVETVPLTAGATSFTPISSLSVGTHTVQVVYAGDPSFSGSTGTLTGGQIVNQAATTTGLVSNNNPSILGQSVTFTATVSANAPGAGTPTGTVNFFDDATLIGSGTLTGGVATFTTSTLTIGTHPITAVYVGDTSFVGSTLPVVNQVVNKIPTTTVVISAPTPSVYGQTVTFTAAVTSGSGIPTGDVEFFVDGVSAGTGTLNGVGLATFSTSTIPVGTHDITATYLGDATHDTSTSATAATQVVNPASTTTAVVSSVNPSLFGQPVVFSVIVSAVPPSSATPTGTVTLIVDGTTTETVALSGGAASFTAISSLAVGTHTVQVNYTPGDGNFNASSGTLAGGQQVVAASTTTLLSSDVNPAVFGQTVTFTATVSANPPGAGTPTGTVSFFDGATLLGTGTLTGGVATFSTSTLSVGTHPITATYGGSTSFSGSSSTVLPQVINKADTTTAVSSNANPSVFGQSVTFSTIVSANAPGAGTPSGNVSLVIDGTTVETVALTAGAASFTPISSLSVGTHTVQVVYAGDSSFNTSTGTLAGGQVVTAADTTLAITGQDPNASIYGQAVTFTATLTIVAPGGGTPTAGSVSFFEDLGGGVFVLIGTTSTFTSIGDNQFTASITTADTQFHAGTHQIFATYSGETNYNPSVSPNVEQIVNAAATSTSVAADPASSVYGQTVTFTATVSNIDTAPVPTGSVQFFVDGTPLGTPVALAAGVASFSTSSLPVGTHTITANYLPDTGDFQVSSGTLDPDYVVNKADVTFTIDASPNPSIIGQTITFTVTVNPQFTGTPTGTITLSEGTTVIAGPTSLTDGTVTFSIPSTLLGVGTHTITVDYSGDANFNPNSTTQDLTVEQAPTTTTIIVDAPDPSVYGQTVTFAALVLSEFAAGPFTGNVAFYDGDPDAGGTLLGTSGVGLGNLSVFTISTLDVGTHDIYARYLGDTNYESSTSAAEPHTVTAAATTTQLTQSVNPTVWGQSVTFTAFVSASSPGSGTPTGTVEFYDGAVNPLNLIGTGTLAGGIATFTTSTLEVGSHDITAVYVSDGNFAGSQSDPLNHQVDQAASHVVLSSDVNPSVYGQTVTFTVLVIAVPPGSGTPTGEVQFYDDGAPIGGPVPLVDGMASISTSNLSRGGHTIVATYSGDSRFAGDDGFYTQTVVKGETTTTIVSSLNPSTYGDAVTFTATVSASAPAAGIPTGTVVFYDNGTPIGVGTLSAIDPSTATFTTSTLTAGEHLITAQYLGDDNFEGSTAGDPVDQIVNKADVLLLAGSDPNPSVLGQSVQFAALALSVAGVPTGLVSFYDGATLLGTDPLDTLGAGSIDYAGLAVGDHTITVVYSGDANFNSQTVDITHTVNPADVTLALTSSVNPSVIGQPVTFTVDVMASTDLAIPSGIVEFFDDGVSLGTQTLDAAGMASLTTSALTAGGHEITVVYYGDANFNGATSSPLSQTVLQGETTTTVDTSENPIVCTAPVTFTASVTVNEPAAGIPTGTVIFYADGSPIGAGTLSGEGPVFTATFTTSSLSAGIHVITAQYLGDDNFHGSTSLDALFQEVLTADSTLSAFSIPNPSSVGQPVTIYVQAMPVDPATGIPSGTVSFYDDGNFIGSAGLDATGQASLVTTFATVGMHNITLIYSGDACFNGSETSLTQEVDSAATTTFLSSTPNPSNYGQAVAFTASVTSTAGVPTGVVRFYDGAVSPGTLFATVGLVGGSATVLKSDLSPGSHTIYAVYSGDATFASSQASVVQMVVTTNTSTTLTATPNPSVWSQTVNFVATVSAGAGGGTPTGMVEFRENGLVLATRPLNALGQATFSTSTLEVGLHTITATYLGEGKFNPSTSSPFYQYVSKAATTGTLTASPSPSNYGQNVVFTMTVSAVSPATGTPTGTVRFFADGVLIGSANLVGGQASVSKANLTVGFHTITAQYLGDAHYNGVSRNITHQVRSSGAAGAFAATGGTSTVQAFAGISAVFAPESTDLLSTETMTTDTEPVVIPISNTSLTSDSTSNSNSNTSPATTRTSDSRIVSRVIPGKVRPVSKFAVRPITSSLPAGPMLLRRQWSR